jgi:transcription antitermination factor NusG
MKTLKIVAVFLSLSLIFQSCATILSGTKSPVKVKGTPAAAKVYMNGVYVGQAPVRIKVPRKKHPNVKIEVKAENYKPVELSLESRLSIGYLGLDILTGLFPLIVDFATGSIYAPYPKVLTYNLEPEGSIHSKFKVGDKVLILNQKYNGYEGEIIELQNDGAKVKFERPATLVEKAKYKKDKVIDEKFFQFSELRKL